MKIRLFEENDIKPIYELLKNELGYEVDYSLFVLRVQEMIKNNYLIYVACIENKVVGFIGIEVSYVFELPKQIMRVDALAVDKNYQNKDIGKQLIQKVEKYAKIKSGTLRIILIIPAISVLPEKRCRYLTRNVLII